MASFKMSSLTPVSDSDRVRRHMDNQPTLASWLRQQLDERGVTVRGLARVIDPVSPERGRRNLHRYLTGSTRPNAPMRKKIADALGVPVSEVPNGDDGEPGQ